MNVNGVKSFFRNNGVLVALAVLVLINLFWSQQREVFFQPENLRNLLTQNAAVGMLAVGMTLVIIGGGIDLSVGSMMALVGALGLFSIKAILWIFEKGHPLASGAEAPGSWLLVATLGAVLTCSLVGTLLGFSNGLIITLGKVAPFIATLAGLVAFRSITLGIGDGGEIRSAGGDLFQTIAQQGVPVPGINMASGKPLLLQWPIFIFLGLALWGHWLLNRSRYGRRLIAVGANEQAAIYSGISSNKIKWAAYAFLGLCTGLAALCQTSKFNSVSTSQLGLYNELDAIAAVVIGGTSMSGGRGQVWTTVIGVLILGIITNMLITSGISVYWQGCVKGVIILFAVLLQRGRATA